MESSKILLKDGQTVDLVDGRIADGDIASWNNKPNVTITSKNDSVNISTSVDAETNTKTFDLSVDSLNITSSDASINVSTSEGVTDLTLPSDVVRDSAYTHIDAATANPLMNSNAAVGISTKYAREDHVHPSDTSKEDIANKTTVVLGTSHDKYPTDKAVAEFVNSSIATNTANYISNNGNPFTSVEQLNTYTGTVTNNDYAFVTGTDSEGNTYYDRYKATVKGSGVTWSLEYRLNNSSFTAAQWSAINSGITSALVAKIHDHSNKDVLDGITSTDVANWNSKMDNQSVGNVSEPVYLENGIAKVATNVATNGKLNAKLNVDGSNATNAGVTAMMKKVSSGTDDLNDDSTYFGDSNADHTQIVRRPILNLWNYIKNKVQTQLLGSVGATDKPIYLENGVPKVCIDGVPFSFVNYGNRPGFGVFVGGKSHLGDSTRCYCSFLVSVSSEPDRMLHTYIGVFSFRGKILNCELRCLTGTPKYPFRIAAVSNVDGGTTSAPTYTVGLFVIPADNNYRFSTYRLTRIASSDFIWDVKEISSSDYDNCNAVAKNAVTVDDMPTKGSNNLVTSSGVWNYSAPAVVGVLAGTTVDVNNDYDNFDRFEVIATEALRLRTYWLKKKNGHVIEFYNLNDFTVALNVVLEVGDTVVFHMYADSGVKTWTNSGSKTLAYTLCSLSYKGYVKFFVTYDSSTSQYDIWQNSDFTFLTGTMKTVMIGNIANASSTNDRQTDKIYYDDIICNNGSIAYTINIARLVIGKTYRFHIMKDTQSGTYLYNYGKSNLGTVNIYSGNSSFNILSNAAFVLYDSARAMSHTVSVARMSKSQLYIIWGY